VMHFVFAHVFQHCISYSSAMALFFCVCTFGFFGPALLRFGWVPVLLVVFARWVAVGVGARLGLVAAGGS
jgi:hypothetical protein